jgi:hypothetical protein
MFVPSGVLTVGVSKWDCAPPMVPPTPPDTPARSRSPAVMSSPVIAAVATVDATPSTPPRTAPSTTLPPRPVALVGMKSMPPPMAPEMAPERAAPPVLFQSQLVRSPLAICRPWMATSMPTSIRTSLRIAMIRRRKIIWTVMRVAACAIGIPAVEAPKVPKAAAIMAAISIASMMSAAMIEYFAYSTSSAQLSHESPRPSQASWSCVR